jgi:Zn-dependent protease with chaperone function
MKREVLECFSFPKRAIIHVTMINRPIFVALAICVVPLGIARSQETPSPVATPAASTQQEQSFDPAAATGAWLATVPANKRAKSDAYFEGGYWLILWNFLVSAAIMIFLLTSRISARLRDFAQRHFRIKALQIALYAICFVLITFLLGFPLEVYQNFFREHAYGLATQTFGPWFRDELVALLVQAIAMMLFLIVIYIVFRRAPRSWWLWGTGLVVLFLMIEMFLSPVFIDPLFNTYKSITNPKIRDPILALARANEIPVHEVFQFNASRQTTRISANVAGFLGTTRIALNDNLLKRCTLPEIRAVMAHEMGHYVLNHGAKLVLYFAVFALVGFALAKIVFDGAVRRWGAKWDVHGIADPAGFPLLALIFVTFAFLITPVSNTVVRVTEREADAFGLNAAREPDGMAKVALKLASYRKLDPGPVEEFIFFDHPSGRARIRMAMDWKAAHLPCADLGAPEPTGQQPGRQ